jgi:hypothetical protein
VSVDRLLSELEQTQVAEQQREEEIAGWVREERAAMEAEQPLPAEPEPEQEKDSERVYAEIDEASAHLAQDGRDYIAALYWMSTGAGFTEPSLTLLCALAAYEDCKELDERGCEVTDAELADFMGCSERTIKRKRKKYFEEEKKLKVPFLQIVEGDFDKSAMQNRPTRYRFLRDTDIADAVLEARKSPLYEKDRRKALKFSALKVYDSLTKPFGQSAVRRRKKKQRPPESERQKILNTMRTLAARLKEVEGQMEGDFNEDWKLLKRELDNIYGARNPSQMAVESKLKLTGCQNVTPSKSVLVITLLKEGGMIRAERSFISESELVAGGNYDDVLKIPAVARIVRGSTPN